MNKLIEDPKVQVLIEREVAKAVKAERKRAVEFVKDLADELKGVLASIKNPLVTRGEGAE